MGYRTLILGLATPAADEDVAALAARLAAPGAELLPAHIVTQHRLGLRRQSGGAQHIAPSAARGLAELALEHDADVVVLGSGRGAGAGHAGPSRTALRLLHEACVAVAVAPRGYREQGRFHHVGVAYDASPPAEAALQAAYRLAARDHAAVTLYWVIGPATSTAPELPPDQSAHQERLRAHAALDAAADAAPDGLNPETLLLHGYPDRAIPEAADGIVDVLFSGSHGYGPLQRALSGSVSEQLLRGATQPVVMTPGPRRSP